MMRHIKHRTSQVRDLTFIRDAIYRKETKTTGTTTGTEGSGSTLAGPVQQLILVMRQVASHSKMLALTWLTM